MTEYRIPFNRPCFVGTEYVYIAESLAHGQISGDGPGTKWCEQFLENELGAPRVLLTTSCTHSLELAALLLDVGPGDEVVVPSFTFVSTANAFVQRGARPVFVDVREDTLNLDERLLDAALSPRTKVVVPVHYAGVGCEMDDILSVAAVAGAAVVEDNAHGLFGRYRGRYLGTLGALAAQSFHETKNFTCGEGGALVVNDPSYVDRAEVIREKGTDRSRFFRGEIDKYCWIDVGSSYVPSDVLAAILRAQLEARDEIQARRRRVWDLYADGIEPWAKEQNVRLPIVPPDRDQSYHLFYLILPSPNDRALVIDTLKQRGILSVFHYLPLHLSPMGSRFGGRPGQCPVSEYVTDRLLRLPFYNDLSESDQCEVIESIVSIDLHR